jgi:hypothetical protein
MFVMVFLVRWYFPGDWRFAIMENHLADVLRFHKRKKGAERRHRPPDIDNRPLFVTSKPNLREYKAVSAPCDTEIALFSDEVVANCTP